MPMDNPDFESAYCPLPLKHDQTVVIGHGSGGRMTRELIEQVFQPVFGNPALDAGNDFARIELLKQAQLQGHLTVAMDAHVVDPIIFPGGDIGRLAVSGTVNDISMSGGIPLYLTASFIIEEGLSIEILNVIVQSIGKTAREAGVLIIAGDTKVVEKGKADKLFISTSGIGWIPESVNIHGANAQDGDAVIISGALGEHGMAVLAARGNLNFKTEIRSDVAPLNHLIQGIIQNAPHVHVLRDPTRGGLATTLNEIALQSQVTIELNEATIPIKQPVKTACEMLGFDPLYVANEGKVIIILPQSEAESAIQYLHQQPLGKDAAVIGMVKKDTKTRVILQTVIGGTRIVDMLAGEMLPRIC